MSTINQCTKCITGETRIIQFYRLCITCSAVGVCLNCAGICHENHTLGPLLREKFYCQCQQITGCCRALNLFVDPNPVSQQFDHNAGNAVSNGHGNAKGASSGGIGGKKRKFNAVKSERIYVWTKQKGSGKVFHTPYYQTKEEANQTIKHLFIHQNPWHLDEKDFYFHDSFVMQYDEQGLLAMKYVAENQEAWEVGADIIEGNAPVSGGGDSLIATGVNATLSHDEGIPPPPLSGSKKAKRAAAANTANHNSPATNGAISHNNEAKESTQSKLSQGIASQDHATTFKLSPNNNTLDDDDEDMVIFTDLKPRYEDFADVDRDKGKKKGARPKKEAGAPKGPVASYMMYSNSRREQVVAENPGMSMIEISRTIGQQWKSLSAEEKHPFEELAKKDKERYLREMEEFKRKKSNGEPIPPAPPVKVKGKPGPKPKQKPVVPPPEIVEAESVDHETEAEAEAEIDNGSHDSGKGENDDDSGSMNVDSSEEKKSVVESDAEESLPEDGVAGSEDKDDLST